MKIHWTKLAGLTLILLIAGCIEQEKDDLTLPVRVHFKIRVQPESFGYATFHSCDIGIQDIQFEGIREAGGNIFFETNPEIGLYSYATFANTTITNFDIPQGIYTYMRWDIHLKSIVTPVDFPDSLSIGLILYGYYELPDDLAVCQIILAVDDNEEFIARFPDRIALSANKDYAATLVFSGNSSLSISYESYLKAEISGDSLNPVLIISRNKNKDLYEKILYQLLRSTRVDIKEIGPST